jgi:hypothetical protein
MPSFEPDHWVNSIAFSPDGDTVALASGGDWKKTVSIWSLASKSRQHSFVIPNLTIDVVVAMSLTGRFVAAGGSALHAGLTETPDQNTIYVLETSTGEPVAKFPGNHSGVTALAFAPDSRTLASGGGDSTILLWDLLGQSRKANTKPLTPMELDARWQDLAGDAGKAFAAIGDLVLGRDASVNSLKSHLSPMPRPTAAELKRLDQLVVELDSDHFATREKAAQELEKMALDAHVLRKLVTKKASAEVRRQIESLLSKEVPEHLRIARALEALETIATPPARTLLQDLAAGDPEAWLTREAVAARDRLRRSEKP